MIRPGYSSIHVVRMVFPGTTNHHGTLFGGEGLALMDKAAFLSASRWGRDTFVTASCQQVDFAAPARQGELADAHARPIRVGRTSMDVEVELHAEDLLSGERRLCTRGVFTMVAPRRNRENPLPPLDGAQDPAAEGAPTHDIVFAAETNHYGTLYGGDALSMMGRSAFIHATRETRKVMVMAASRHVDFVSPIHEGEMVELVSRVERRGDSSIDIAVELLAESLVSAARRRAATASFVMVAVDRKGRPLKSDTPAG